MILRRPTNPSDRPRVRCVPMDTRRPTRPVFVGDDRVGVVQIGGLLPDSSGAASSASPVSVQTMTAGYTHDIDKCVAEIDKLVSAGAQLVRVAVPERKDTAALPEILNQTCVPIVADVHFHFKRALESVEAGVHKIRLNPGNISDRDQVHAVIDACKERKIPIRVGVNEGSIVERKDKHKRLKELGAVFGDHKHGYMLAIMITKLEEYLELFDRRDFHDVVISAKSMDATLVIEAYREISRRFDHPLHLGVTHAGPKETGCIRSIAALGALLAEGVGDTIRISYASDPIYEVEDGLELLYALGLRERIGGGPHRLPDLRADPGRSLLARAGRAQAVGRRGFAPDESRGDGVCGQWAGRSGGGGRRRLRG